MTTRGRVFNLTAALAVAALADLALHRIVGRLFLPQHPSDGWERLLVGAARFAFHLSGVLGFLVVVAVLAAAARRGDLLPRSTRFAVAAVALVFATLAGASVFLLLPLPDRFLVHLKISHAFLAWFVVVALWRGTAPLRGKVAVTLFALGPILHALALFFQRTAESRPFPLELARAADLCALLAAALAPYLLSPEGLSTRRRVWGLAAGGLALLALVWGLSTNLDLMQAVALFGFRLEIPSPNATGGLLFLGLVIAAGVGLVVAVAWTLPGQGSSRLVGYGLVLVAAAGYQSIAPNQLLFLTGGLLALAGGQRPGVPREARPEPALAAPVTS